ncbi:hypothetical protein SLEP1_g16127 [Rubroshorea leprosula]|uniref:Uncharacterized protein n=1 Tax=Rubroshorea leprosula TaxID=152421 RepID=A0AAV5IPX0_9ROSI|nr:hypothetical protein SLEP1_g16127 [Rubroshorea leprosula]
MAHTSEALYERQRPKAISPLLSNLQKSTVVERLKGFNFGVLRIKGGEEMGRIERLGIYLGSFFFCFLLLV